MGNNFQPNIQQVKNNVFTRRKKDNKDKWSVTIKPNEKIRIVGQIINDIWRRNFNASDPTTQKDFLDENIVQIINEVCSQKMQYQQTISSAVMNMRNALTNNMEEYNLAISQYHQGLIPYVKVYDPDAVTRCDNISNFMNRSNQTWFEFNNGYNTYVNNSRSMGQPDVTQLIKLFNYVSSNRHFFDLDGMYTITRY